MASTMSQLMTQVYGELGTRTIPTAFASSTDVDVIQMLALMNGMANSLQRQYQWQAITNEYRFTTSFLQTTGNWLIDTAIVTGIPTTAALSAGSWQAIGTGINTDVYIQSVDSGTQVTLTQPMTATQVAGTITFCKTKYPMPTDYDRLIDGTQWDKSKHWQMIGPETMQQKEWLKSGYISTGPRIRYYLEGGTFQIWPPMSTAEYLGFDYVGKNWVSSASALQPDKTAFTVDTDTCIFPDRLMVEGTKLWYFQIKQFDTTAFQNNYDMQLDIAKANDAGSPTLAMAPLPSGILINFNNIPDTGYGT